MNRKRNYLSLYKLQVVVDLTPCPNIIKIDLHKEMPFKTTEVSVKRIRLVIYF